MACYLERQVALKSEDSVHILEGKAILYKREGTPAWQVRYRVGVKKLRNTTNEIDINKAKSRAVDIVMNAWFREKNLPTELGLQVQQSLQAGSQFLQDELQHRMQQTLAPTQTRLQSLAHDSALYARLAHHSARRITLVAMISGAIAGALGGVLAGVALARYLN